MSSATPERRKRPPYRAVSRSGRCGGAIAARKAVRAGLGTGASWPSDAVAALADGFDHRRVAELARNRPMVVTVAVNGSMSSSHTRSRSSSAETGFPSAASRHSSTASSLRVSARRSPARNATRRTGIETQIAVGELGWRHGGASSHRPDTGDQLGELEGLGQVVVGAESQPLDAIFDRARSGEHQHPARRPSVTRVGKCRRRGCRAGLGRAPPRRSR